jgi:hypothetical protein
MTSRISLSKITVAGRQRPGRRAPDHHGWRVPKLPICLPRGLDKTTYSPRHLDVMFLDTRLTACLWFRVSERKAAMLCNSWGTGKCWHKNQRKRCVAEVVFLLTDKGTRRSCVPPDRQRYQVALNRIIWMETSCGIADPNLLFRTRRFKLVGLHKHRTIYEHGARLKNKSKTII